MSSSPVESRIPAALSVTVTHDTLSVELSDGRTISVPVAWYPRLVHASVDERNNWELTARGQGIHWSDLDEDISVENLLAGKASGESQKSLQAWLKQRPSGSD